MMSQHDKEGGDHWSVTTCEINGWGRAVKHHEISMM